MNSDPIKFLILTNSARILSIQQISLIFQLQYQYQRKQCSMSQIHNSNSNLIGDTPHDNGEDVSAKSPQNDLDVTQLAKLLSEHSISKTGSSEVTFKDWIFVKKQTYQKIKQVQQQFSKNLKQKYEAYDLLEDENKRLTSQIRYLNGLINDLNCSFVQQKKNDNTIKGLIQKLQYLSSKQKQKLINDLMAYRDRQGRFKEICYERDVLHRQNLQLIERINRRDGKIRSLEQQLLETKLKKDYYQNQCQNKGHLIQKTLCQNTKNTQTSSQKLAQIHHKYIVLPSLRTSIGYGDPPSQILNQDIN